MSISRTRISDKEKAALVQRDSAREDSRRVGTCQHRDREILTNTTQAEPQSVATSRSQAMVCATQENSGPGNCTGGASKRVGTSCHSAQRIFSKTVEPGLCHVLFWLDWSALRQIQRVCTLPPRVHPPAVSFAAAVSMARSGLHTHRTVDNQKRYTKGGNMFFAALQGHCAVDYDEVLGLLRKWEALPKLRRDPNPKRTAALAHALPWLDDEQLYHLYAEVIAAWKEQ